MRALLAALIFCALAGASRAKIGGEHLGWWAANVSRQETVMASCYGREHHQVRTATGQNYDPWRLTAAHRSWPFGTRVLVTNRRNGRSVAVTINDRGPAAWTHRAIDLSLGACSAIGNSGLAPVVLQIIGGPHEARSQHRHRHHHHARRRG